MPRTCIPSTRFALALLAAGALTACNDPAGEDTPYVVTPVTPTTLAGTPGWTLTDTLVVEVRDAEGHVVPGAQVRWSLPNGGSLVVQLAEADDRLTGSTDDRGRNYAVWTLGLSEGAQVARAAAGTESQAAFTATATALHALDVAVGGDHVCAILTDQRPVCWGANQNGQLGVGDLVSRAAPTALEGLDAALEIVASPSNHTCARDLAGDVWCWGRGAYGAAGALASGSQETPVRVPGAEGATSLGLGYLFSCAILNPGGARCWGTNDGGRLGAGFWSLGGSSNPTPQIVVGGGNFVRLGVGDDRVCAVDSDGEAWCWGNTGFGTLSPYPSNDYNSPVHPVPGYKFSDVAVTWNTNCGLAVGGDVLCWGNNVGLGQESAPRLTMAPIRPRIDGSFAQLTSTAGRFYGRTRDGRIARWGTFNFGYPLGPESLDLPVRAVDVAVGGYGYCIIAESSALYCEPDTYPPSGLRPFPATPIP